MYPYSSTGVTVELRELVNNNVDIWDFQYPSYYRGDDKLAFEQKVIDHFYFRQIGQETPARWLHYFRSRIREIMPYYIQLYESAELMASIEDPFGNVDVTETYTETRTGTSSGETNESVSSEGSDTRRNEVAKERRYSNTPQGTVANLEHYLTDAEVNEDTEDIAGFTESSGESTINQTGTSSETVEHTFKKTGNQGVNTYAHDMKELRETFLNIDLQIINELNDLFLMVY